MGKYDLSAYFGEVTRIRPRATSLRMTRLWDGVEEDGRLSPMPTLGPIKLDRRWGTRIVLLLLLAAGLASAAPAKKKPTAGKPIARHGSKLPAAKSFASAKKPSAKGKALAHARPSSSRATATAPIIRFEGGRAATIARITQTLAGQRPGIEFADALAPFFDKLRALELDPRSQEVRILQFGDSHTAADMFTGAMRILFQGKWGDGGAGYSYPGYPFAGYRIHGTRRSQSVGWKVLGVKLSDIGDAMVGMGGVSESTAQPGSWISLDADAASLEVQYLIQPGGGEIDIYDGETLMQTLSTDGPISAGHFDTDVVPGQHHFEVRTKSYAPVRLFGMRTEQVAGVTYEALGLNGAEAGQTLRFNEQLQQTLMEQRQVGLIVLAYGTNEASDSNWTEESYAAMFRRLIARCRREAPGAAILVIGPADRELRAGRRGWAAYSGIDRIVRAQRSVCRELGCAYWDERSRMGGFGSMAEWVSVSWGQPDHTHFTGEGYTELASALFSDIVQQYNSYTGATGGLGKGTR